MGELFESVAGFVLCAAAIVVSGIQLTRYGERLADLSGLGRLWFGMVLMAGVTSLPELVTGIGAVTFVNAPNLAVGDVMGSCMFNLLILSLMDVRINRPITSLVKPSHLLTGLFGIVLVSIAGLAILFSNRVPNWGWISPFSAALLLAYLVAIAMIYRFEKADVQSSVVNLPKATQAEWRRTVRNYGLHALVVVTAALFLPHLGNRIATLSGINNTFFGTVFLAASTSLAEVVVSFAAIRTAAYDLLMGNLLGSNLFNLAVLALDDAFYLPGSLYASIEPGHLESALVIVLMTSIVGLGVMIKPTRTVWRLGLDALLIIMLYVGLMVSLYFLA